MNKKIKFNNCPISDKLIDICEHDEKCDICAGSCLFCGIILDILLICPRFIIYKCNCKCNICKSNNTVSNSVNYSENKNNYIIKNNYISNEPK